MNFDTVEQKKILGKKIFTKNSERNSVVWKNVESHFGMKKKIERNIVPKNKQKIFFQFFIFKDLKKIVFHKIFYF